MSPQGNEILLRSWKLINEMSVQTALVYLFGLCSLVSLMKRLIETTAGSICTVVQFWQTVSNTSTKHQPAGHALVSLSANHDEEQAKANLSTTAKEGK